MTARKATPTERGRAGITVRLMREDRSAMTRAANASPNHVASMDRWERKARESDPALDDGQVEQRAAELRREFYRGMQQRSAAAQRQRGKNGV